MALSSQAAEPATWVDVFAAWEILEADMHATYSIDLDDIPTDRTWRWLRARIRGVLLDPTSRMTRATTTIRR